jgi:hypothetical protein
VTELLGGANQNTPETSAAAAAAAALGLAATEPAQVWRVGRIRPALADYFLVVFGSPQAAVGIAAVDSASLTVFAKAKLPGRSPHCLISACQAIRLARMDPDAEADLVWDPVPASSSPFYPLWRLRRSGRTLWVDSVTGRLTDTLESPTGGGRL